MLICPCCQKKTVRRSTIDETKLILPLLEEWGIVSEDENEDERPYVLVCPNCGWYETLHNFSDGSLWTDQYKRIHQVLNA